MMEEEKKLGSERLINTLGNHKANRGGIKSLAPDDDNVSSENEGTENTTGVNDNPGNSLASNLESLSLSSINSSD